MRMLAKDLPHAETETGTRCAVTLNRNMEARRGLNLGMRLWRRGAADPSAAIMERTAAAGGKALQLGKQTTCQTPRASLVPSQKPPHGEGEGKGGAGGARYLLVSIVADVQRVAVFVHLLRPAARRRAVLTVRLARVGAEAGVLRRQRLEVPDGERQVGDDRRGEREGRGLTVAEREREKEREGDRGNFHQRSRGQTSSQKSPEPQRGGATHSHASQSLEPRHHSKAL